MMRNLIVALQFLTRLPTPQLDHFEAADLGKAAAYFPLIGLLIGVPVAASAWLGAYINPWVGALAGLVAWIGVTGGVHLDGLGDVADALGAAHRDSRRFHDVLADPHAGSFAVIAIALQIVTKLVLLAALPAAGVGALVLVPAWARWGTLVLSRYLPALKPGLGRSFADGASVAGIAAWCAALLAASAAMAPALASGLLIVALVAGYWRLRLGGITGDCLGASVEMTESLLLLALAIGGNMTKPLLG